MQRRKSGTGELAPGRAWSQAHRQYHEHAFKQHHKDGKLLQRQVDNPNRLPRGRSQAFVKFHKQSSTPNLKYLVAGKTLPINSRPHSILEQSMVVSTKSKQTSSQVPMKPKTRPKSRQLESVADRVKSHQKSTKASQQKQIKKQISFPGFPWTTQKAEDWATPPQVVFLEGPSRPRRAKSEMKNHIFTPPTRRPSTTLYQKPIQPSKSRSAKVEDWLNRNTFQSRESKLDLRHAWSEKI